jgi:hypothetical protein
MDTTSPSTTDTPTGKRRYWILVASRNHVQRGVEGGFAQANHGKATTLKRMRQGDGVIYYSSKEVFGEDAKCQRFTAIGEIADEALYQGSMGGDFNPFRRNVEYWPCQEASILPLVDDLTFIKDKVHWGAPFRFGALEIQASDFELIASAMLKK